MSWRSLVSVNQRPASQKSGQTATTSHTGWRSTASRTSPNTKRRSEASNSWKWTSERRTNCDICRQTRVSISSVGCTCGRATTMRSPLTYTGRRPSVSTSTGVPPSLASSCPVIGVPAGQHSHRVLFMTRLTESHREDKWETANMAIATERGAAVGFPRVHAGEAVKGRSPLHRPRRRPRSIRLSESTIRYHRYRPTRPDAMPVTSALRSRIP